MSDVAGSIAPVVSRRVIRRPVKAHYFLPAAVVPVLAVVLDYDLLLWSFVLSVPLVLFGVTWPRLILTQDGPIVINLFVHRIAWEDIAAVDEAWRLQIVYLGFWVRGRRRPVRSWAVCSAYHGVGSCVSWVTATTSMVNGTWRQAQRST